MRAPGPATPEETRADVARRRLAQLMASFDAELPPPDDPGAAPAHVRRGVERSHVRVLATLAVAASVLLVWWLLAGRPHTSRPATPLAFSSTAPASTPVPASAASTAVPSGAAAPAAAEVVVDVIGKVRRPGIVTLAAGSRVFEAVEAAGGLRGTVDTATLNMARVVADGEQILVGIVPAVVPGTPPSATTPGSAGPGVAPTAVNLNTATAEQLDTLPGIGPVTAQAILDWRAANGRFAAVEDLLEVKGIGDATLAELRDHVVV